MSDPPSPTRFIGLDIHKEFFVAIGVDKEQNQVFGPHTVRWPQFEKWALRYLRSSDAVVLEMTTNTYPVYDFLIDQAHSVLVVHPPHIKLIVRAQVMTDRKAALALAQLHAAGLLTGVWIPPQEIRDLRSLVAQRDKMSQLSTRAKNRLHAILHRGQVPLPREVKIFSMEASSWWAGLPISESEKTVAQSHLSTLLFAQGQIKYIEARLAVLASDDPRVPLLVQLPGISLVHAMTLIAAIGEIERFPSSKHLVGYSGLYPAVKQSGKGRWRGKITKAGRKDLRRAMVEAAQSAARTHPHWKAELARLEPLIGWPKAIVAIARKLLIAVWHIWTKRTSDRFAVEEKVAAGMYALAYKIGIKNLPDQMSAREFTRYCLDLLEIGQELERFPWGSKRPTLPPSTLKPPE
jgi:transposase